MGVEKGGPFAKQRGRHKITTITRVQPLALRPDKPSPHDQRAEAQQDGFLREVDEALRQDEMLDLAKRYGKVLGLTIGVGLLGLGGYLWWNHSRDEAAAARSEQTILALDKMGGNELSLGVVARDMEPLTKDGSDGSRAVAASMEAAILMQQGKREDAARAFGKIAADADMPQPFRDMALVRQVSINFETMQPQQVIDQLKGLAVPGNAWFGSAGELVSMAYLKQGKPQLAGPLLAAIAKDKGVPDSLRSRTGSLAAQLGFDPGSNSSPAPAAQP